MKTTADRLKTLLQDNTTLKTKFKKVEHVGVQTLGAINRENVPYLGIAWTGTKERWLAQKRENTHTFDIYIITHLQIKETAIVGDTAFDGMLTLVSDVMTALRNTTLTSYLDKPADITTVTPTRLELGDNYYLFVTVLALECVKVIG